MGLSICSPITSTPASASAFADSASLAGLSQPPVHTTRVVTLGLTASAPIVNELMLRGTWGIGNAATKPSLSLLVVPPAAIPDRYMASSELAKYVPTLALVFRPPACRNFTLGYFSPS